MLYAAGINGRYVDEENAKKMRERCMRLDLILTVL